MTNVNLTTKIFKFLPSFFTYAIILFVKLNLANNGFINKVKTTSNVSWASKRGT
jgi:hypothetical protein